MMAHKDHQMLNTTDVSVMVAWWWSFDDQGDWIDRLNLVRPTNCRCHPYIHAAASMVKAPLLAARWASE